uniref:Uncharacterized protein n=1 Tax=Micrurus lemniscatus lemniscatus TaxID=129467 RepID=A0A2D4HBF7_MICLE
MIQHTHSHDVQDEEEQEDQMEQVEKGSIHDSDQVLSEVDALERGMSDDEGIKPDQPVFTGLFHPQLFKSLLFKAKTTARLDIPSPFVQQSVVQEESEDLIFSQPMTEEDVIPVRQMFSDPVQNRDVKARKKTENFFCFFFPFFS